MDKRRLSKGLIRIIETVSSFLPMFFWLFLIFGFEEPALAVVTLFAALAHEGGHIGYILLSRELPWSIKSVMSGFRIKASGRLSYSEEICVYAAGPAVNIILFLLFSLLSLLLGEIAIVIAAVNLVTALSNLLPIRGYDGYGILRTALEWKGKSTRPLILLDRISSALIFSLSVLSLYFIDRYGGGYWIFAVFFIAMINQIKDGLKE